jgi:hypothetical protein
MYEDDMSVGEGANQEERATKATVDNNTTRIYVEITQVARV